ncbi:MAG: flagellar motor protein [Armatimonadetes bacterium]|nr:flagellar motor protein [Armatimonadota bacterium]
MDVATVLGLFLAWGALLVSLNLEGGSPKDLFNAPALVLVLFGTFGATIVGSNIKTVLSLPRILRNCWVKSAIDPVRIIEVMVGFARKARMEGILSLENAASQADNKFLKKGIELIVDGTPSVMVREILETEIVAMQERHKVGETFFTTLGGFAPTLGIIGTVMGLISMLAKLNEPNKMGHAIAAAFTATFYGVALANLLFLPIAAKLRSKTAEEVVACEMIIEGILSIQAGDNPRTVETRMSAYLPPELRRNFGRRPSRTERDREALAA